MAKGRHSQSLRVFLFFTRGIIFLISLYLLGLFIYPTVRLSNSAVTNFPTGGRTSRKVLTILILSAVSVTWCLVSFLLTCVGNSKSSAVMIAMDGVQTGAWIAPCVLLKTGGDGLDGWANRCMTRCGWLEAAFVVGIILSTLYFIAFLSSIVLLHNSLDALPYEPSPENGYSTSASNAPPARIHRRRNHGIIPTGVPTTTTAPAENTESVMTTDAMYTGSTLPPTDGAFTRLLYNTSENYGNSHLTTGYRGAAGSEVFDGIRHTGPVTVEPEETRTRTLPDTQTYSAYRMPSPVVVEMPSERGWGIMPVGGGDDVRTTGTF